MREEIVTENVEGEDEEGLVNLREEIVTENVECEDEEGPINMREERHPDFI